MNKIFKSSLPIIKINANGMLFYLIKIPFELIDNINKYQKYDLKIKEGYLLNSSEFTANLDLYNTIDESFMIFYEYLINKELKYFIQNNISYYLTYISQKYINDNIKDKIKIINDDNKYKINNDFYNFIINTISIKDLNKILKHNFIDLESLTIDIKEKSDNSNEYNNSILLFLINKYNTFFNFIFIINELFDINKIK